MVPFWSQILTQVSPVAHLFLCLFEEEPEALVFLDPCRQLSLTLLPGLLQLRLQLPQHVQLLCEPGLPCPRHLQVQFQVQRSPQETVQTFYLHGRLTGGQGGNQSKAADANTQTVRVLMVPLSGNPDMF